MVFQYVIYEWVYYIIILNEEHKQNLEENENTTNISNYIFIKKVKVLML